MNNLAEGFFGEEISRSLWRVTSFNELTELSNPSFGNFAQVMYGSEIDARGRESKLTGYLTDKFPEQMFIYNAKTDEIRSVKRDQMLCQIFYDTELYFLEKKLELLRQDHEELSPNTPYLFWETAKDLEKRFLADLYYPSDRVLVISLIKLLDSSVQIPTEEVPVITAASTSDEKIAHSKAVFQDWKNLVRILRDLQSKEGLDDIGLFSRLLKRAKDAKLYSSRVSETESRTTGELIDMLKTYRFFVFSHNSRNIIKQLQFPGDLLDVDKSVTSKTVVFTYSTYIQGTGMQTDEIIVRYSFDIPLTVQGLKQILTNDTVAVSFGTIQERLRNTVIPLLKPDAGRRVNKLSVEGVPSKPLQLDPTLETAIFNLFLEEAPEGIIDSQAGQGFGRVVITRSKARKG